MVINIKVEATEKDWSYVDLAIRKSEEKSELTEEEKERFWDALERLEILCTEVEGQVSMVRTPDGHYTDHENTSVIIQNGLEETPSWVEMTAAVQDNKAEEVRLTDLVRFYTDHKHLRAKENEAA